MDCEVSKSNAGLAALVWRETGLPELSEEKLHELGVRLEKAVSWAKVDSELVAGVGDRQSRSDAAYILKASAKMAGLLKNDELSRRFCRYYQDGFEEPSLDQLSSGLKLLSGAAINVQEELKRKARRKSPIGNSTSDRFIFKLADIYEAYSPKKAGASIATIGGSVGGPFIRFVHETANRFEGPKPGGSSIRAALATRRKPGTLKHVIGLIK
jgi:hypothetical protein